MIQIMIIVLQFYTYPDQKRTFTSHYYHQITDDIVCESVVELPHLVVMKLVEGRLFEPSVLKSNWMLRKKKLLGGTWCDSAIDDLTSNVCGCGSSAQHLVGRRCNWFLAARPEALRPRVPGHQHLPTDHFLHCCKYLQVHALRLNSAFAGLNEILEWLNASAASSKDGCVCVCWSTSVSLSRAGREGETPLCRVVSFDD